MEPIKAYMFKAPAWTAAEEIESVLLDDCWLRDIVECCQRGDAVESLYEVTFTLRKVTEEEIMKARGEQ